MYYPRLLYKGQKSRKMRSHRIVLVRDYLAVDISEASQSGASGLQMSFPSILPAFEKSMTTVEYRLRNLIPGHILSKSCAFPAACSCFEIPQSSEDRWQSHRNIKE